MGPPPRPTIVVKTVDEDGSSGTGEEFSLASEDDFASKEEEDDDEEDLTVVPPAHQRAAGRAAAAQAHDAGPNKEAEVGANRRAIKEPRPEPTGEPSREAQVDNPRDPTEKKRSSRPRVTVLPME